MNDFYTLGAGMDKLATLGGLSGKAGLDNFTERANIYPTTPLFCENAPSGNRSLRALVVSVVENSWGLVTKLDPGRSLGGPFKKPRRGQGPLGLGLPLFLHEKRISLSILSIIFLILRGFTPDPLPPFFIKTPSDTPTTRRRPPSGLLSLIASRNTPV